MRILLTNLVSRKRFSISGSAWLLNSSWNSEVKCLFEHSSLHLVATKYWMRTYRRSLSKDQCMMKYWTQLEWTSHLIITRKVNFTVTIQQKHLLIILSPELFTKVGTTRADNKIWFRMPKVVCIQVDRTTLRSKLRFQHNPPATMHKMPLLKGIPANDTLYSPASKTLHLLETQRTAILWWVSAHQFHLFRILFM